MLLFENQIAKLIEWENLYLLFCSMAKKINYKYIYSLFAEETNIVLYSFETITPDINNCPCGIIYKTEKKDEEISIYILFIATKYKYRNLGYATICINEFIEHITKKYNKYANVNIVLDSVEQSVTFYEHIGFKWETEEIKYNEAFGIDETNKDEHFIMVKNVIK